MTGRLGVELSPDAVSAADREVIKRGIAAYKELRPILHCSELYRGRSPHESRTTELTFVLPDKRNAVFFGFRREGKAAKELLKLSPGSIRRCVTGSRRGILMIHPGCSRRSALERS